MRTSRTTQEASAKITEKFFGSRLVVVSAFDRSGRCVDVSEGFAGRSRTTRAALRGRGFADVHAHRDAILGHGFGSSKTIARVPFRSKSDKPESTWDVEIIAPDDDDPQGRILVVESRSEPVFEPRSLVASERAQHHRMANHLHVVSVLVGSIGRDLPAVARRANLVRGRVETIARLHEVLSGRRVAGTVELAGYLERVGGLVLAIAGIADESIRVEGNVSLDAERASNVGLLVHELLVLALEDRLEDSRIAIGIGGAHDGCAGRIEVRWRRRAERVSVLDTLENDVRELVEGIAAQSRSALRVVESDGGEVAVAIVCIDEPPRP